MVIAPTGAEQRTEATQAFLPLAGFALAPIADPDDREAGDRRT